MMRFHRVEGGVGVGKEVGNLIHSYVDLGYGRSVVDTANLLCYEVQENAWFDSKKFSFAFAMTVGVLDYIRPILFPAPTYLEIRVVSGVVEEVD